MEISTHNLSLADYTDVYFLRAVQILQALELNPFVRAQVFIRQGPGTVHGINEVIDLISANSALLTNHGNIFALREGDPYEPEETLLIIEGRAQDVLPLETVLLGILSAETTKVNDNLVPNLESIRSKMAALTSLVAPRPIFYFGARHWRYDLDAAITQACFNGGAAGASTACGAATANKRPVGTIPHSLEAIFAWKYGLDRVVVESTKAFDRIIGASIPRIALVDFRNKEVDDSLQTAKVLGEKLAGIRVDTCGENVMQGGARQPRADQPFWGGTGVTISGIHHLRTQFNKAGYPDLQIVLSSGFGDINKVIAFVDAERELGVQLFDSLGVGNLFESRIATMDMVGVGETIDQLVPIAKTGRGYKPNDRLQRIVPK